MSDPSRDVWVIIIVLLFFISAVAMAGLPFLIAFIIERIIDWRRGRAGPGGFPVLPPDSRNPGRRGPSDELTPRERPAGRGLV